MYSTCRRSSESYRASSTASSMRGDAEGVDLVAAGLADIHTVMASQLVVSLDVGKPIRILTGIHAGCFELFGTDRIRSIKDLKGRTVAVPVLGSSHYLYVASIAAYVGLDPQKDIRFVTPPVADSARMLAAGQIDAIVAFPPSRKSYGNARSGTLSSIAAWTNRGRSTFVAC